MGFSLPLPLPSSLLAPSPLLPSMDVSGGRQTGAIGPLLGLKMEVETDGRANWATVSELAQYPPAARAVPDRLEKA